MENITDSIILCRCGGRISVDLDLVVGVIRPALRKKMCFKYSYLVGE